MKARNEIEKIIIEGLMKVKVVNQVMYIDAKSYHGKLTKADAGRLLASMSPKEFSDFLCGSDKVVLIDAIAAGAKLTKADAGRALDATIENIHRKLKVVFGG